jgi:hypothetical protein
MPVPLSTHPEPEDAAAPPPEDAAAPPPEPLAPPPLPRPPPFGTAAERVTRSAAIFSILLFRAFSHAVFVFLDFSASSIDDTASWGWAMVWAAAALT